VRDDALHGCVRDGYVRDDYVNVDGALWQTLKFSRLATRLPLARFAHDIANSMRKALSKTTKIVKNHQKFEFKTPSFTTALQAH
jgi:hypothetical protein